MKKLLYLLGSVGLLVTPVTNIVSCNSKNKTESASKEETDNTKFFSEAIKDFKNEVSEIVTSNILEANKSLIEIENNSRQNYFLNKENIKNHKNEQKDLDKTDKENLYKDVFNKMYITKIKDEINSLKNNNKYNLILGNINEVFNDLEIYWPSLKFDYNDDFSDVPSLKQEETNDKPYTSSVYLEFDIKTSYIDQANKQADFNVKKEFIYSLTNSKVISLLGKTVLSDVEFGYLLEGNKESKAWLDSDILNMQEKDKNVVINNNEVSSYFNKSVFKDNLISSIKNSIKEGNSSTPWLDKINLDFSSQGGFSKIEWQLNINSTIQNTQKLHDLSKLSDIDPEAEKTFEYIFNRKNPIDKQDKKLGGSSQKVDVQIFNYLKENHKDTIVNYKKEIATFKEKTKSKIDPKLYKKLEDLDLSSSSKLGYVYFKDLEFKVGSYSQKLPEFRLLTAYSVDKNSKNWDVNSEVPFEDNKTFESAYYNIIRGIESFRKTFGIVDSSPTGGFTAMTGKTPNIAKNLWETFNSSEAWYKYGVNDSLSLGNSYQKEYKDYLLKEGNQEVFGWTLFGERSNTKVKVAYQGYINSGTVLEVQGNYAEDVNFKLDFLNISFRIPGFWNKSAEGKTIISRVAN